MSITYRVKGLDKFLRETQRKGRDYYLFHAQRCKLGGHRAWVFRVGDNLHFVFVEL